MSHRRFTRSLQHVFATAQQFDDAQRHIGKALAVRRILTNEPGLERSRIGLRRQPIPLFGSEGDDAIPPFRGADDAAD